MRSLIFHGPRDIRCETVPDPVISHPASAIVKITKCGLCGSDLHPYHVGSSNSGYGIGHEAVGEVIDVGAAVSRFKVGDRVLVAGSVSCGACEECRAGRAMTCRAYPTCRVFGQGMHGLAGCQAEALEVPVADFNMHILPDSMSDALGIMLSDNLVTAWTCAQLARVRPAASVAVIGLGAVGLQSVLAAKAMGADCVFGVDLLSDRRAAALAFGAIPISGDNTLEEIRTATSGEGVDCVLDTVGTARTTELDMLVARRGGHVCIVGLPETPHVAFPLITGIARNITLSMAACSIQSKLPELFRALEIGQLDVSAIESLVTHDMPLSEGAAAYELFDARRDGVKKILLTP